MYLPAYLELYSISQKDFAEKVGIHQSSLNNYLKGRRVPTAQICVRIEKASHDKVTIDELIKFPYTLKKT
jgi:transcriptional regulator with XRE-family HTH domain